MTAYTDASGLDDVTIGQLFETLIWQATDLEGTPLDYLNFERDDIPSDQQETLIGEFRQFCQDNDSDIRDFMSATGLSLDNVAHDYILTRNGHGAGFWDRGAGDVGERLSDACQVWGEIDVYISDDGTLEIS